MAKASVVEISGQRRKTVDELGVLIRQIEEFEPVKQRYESLRKQVLSWHEDAPAAEPLAVDGHRLQVHFSPRGKKRRIISMLKVFKLCGQKRFLDLCEFPLKALDVLLDASAQKGIVSEDLSGPRHVVAVTELEGPAAALQAA